MQMRAIFGLIGVGLWIIVQKISMLNRLRFFLSSTLSTAFAKNFVFLLTSNCCSMTTTMKMETSFLFQMLHNTKIKEKGFEREMSTHLCRENKMFSYLYIESLLLRYSQRLFVEVTLEKKIISRCLSLMDRNEKKPSNECFWLYRMSACSPRNWRESTKRKQLSVFETK